MSECVRRNRPIEIVDLKPILEALRTADGSPIVVEDGGVAYTTGHTLRAVCALACASKADHLLEIGTAYGHTTVKLAEVLPSSQVYTLGTCKEILGETSSPFKGEVLPREKQGIFIRQQSSEIRRRIHALVAAPGDGRLLLGSIAMPSFQFVFIDGDHSWRSVVEDTKAALQYIDPQGTIVWDDYGQALDTTAFINVLNGRVDHSIRGVRETRIVFVRLDVPLRIEMLKALGDM